MEKYFNWISLVIGAVGGFLTGIFGGWDMLLKTIVGLVILDYLTGVIKGIYTKQLSSEIGYRGILKKVMVFIVIATAYILQGLVGGNIPLREMVIWFFIANEGLSLIENAAVMIPMPKRLKDVLLQIRERAESEGDDGKRYQ